MVEPLQVGFGLVTVSVLVVVARPVLQWLIARSPAPIHRSADFFGLCNDPHPRLTQELSVTSTIPLPDADLDAKRASVAPITELVNDRTGLGLSDDEMGRMIGEAARASLASDDLIELDRDGLVALAREEKSIDRSWFTRDSSRAHNARVDEARRRCDELGLTWDVRDGAQS